MSSLGLPPLVLVFAGCVGGNAFFPRQAVARMGPDSLTVLVLYAHGVAGLVTIAVGTSRQGVRSCPS